ncbi:actin-like ATPase domain-containing protein [Wilcoxina mikolae CBS 423.85]|nr:actin-like ATPase domain-containing protein [Wilcoxina mikolae CBS 423.85]
MVATVDPSKHRFVVGVDFGTTFTSVAFAHTASPEEVKLVQTWPNGRAGNSSADQVPSEIRYTNPSTRAKKWGYEVSKITNSETSSEPLRWFKLLLQGQSTPAAPDRDSLPLRTLVLRHGHRRTTEHAPLRTSENAVDTVTLLSERAQSGDMRGSIFTPPTITPAQKTAYALQELHIAPVTVVEDFLSSVLKITTESIERTYETQWVRESTVEYVLTVPAIWTDSAKALMVKAAERAGFGVHRVDFNLVSEPESAAAYTLKAIQPNDLNKNDTFIICDAGGGTVDLISYKITDLNPLKLDESVSGTGDLCGSVFLDERFEKYIRGVLGDKVIDDMKPRSKYEMMRTWEEKVKFTFGNSEDAEDDGYEVNVPGVPDNDETNVEDGFHSMQNDAVQKIFNPIVNRIIDLVKQQVLAVERKGDRVAAILLVGGFGSSEYLLKRLKETRYGRTSVELQVLQPMNARSAIARGALLRGLDGSIVKKRRARRFYGSLSTTHFKEGRGWDEHKYWDIRKEEWKVRERLNWYIKKDMVVGNTESVTLHFSRTLDDPIPAGHLIFHDDLLECNLQEAPEFKWEDPYAVHRVCTVTADLTGVPQYKFRRFTNSSGQKYCSVSFDLRVTLVDEVLKFDLLYDGEVYGEATTRFEAD